MYPAEMGLFNYTLLWLYAACFILIWVYLPLVDKEEAPPWPAWLEWGSIVMHVAGFAAIVVFLMEIAIAGPFLWWPLLGVFTGWVLLEDVMAYRWMRRYKLEPRATTNQHRIVCFIGAAIHTVLRLPCAVMIHRLAERV